MNSFFFNRNMKILLDEILVMVEFDSREDVNGWCKKLAVVVDLFI